MAKQMPLRAELNNCLAAYRDTFERIMNCFDFSEDGNVKKHESPPIIQVQDLISIDAELKRHSKRMDEWEERQERIKQLEAELDQLSSQINTFTRELNETEGVLEGCCTVARKLQKDVAQKRQIMAENPPPGPGQEVSAASLFPWLV